MRSMTVSRRLGNEFGMKSNKSVRKPCLTTDMKIRRQDFTKKYWTAEQWGMFLFSEESLVQELVVCKRHVRRPPCKRFEEKHTIPTMKHPPSQMIWCVMHN